MLNTFINVCTLVCVCSILQYFLSLTHCCHSTTLHIHACVFRLHCVCVCVCVHANVRSANCNKGNQKTWMNTRLLAVWVFMHVCMYLCNSRALIIKRIGFDCATVNQNYIHTYKHMYILCTYLCMVMNDRQFNKKNQIKSNVFLVYTANNCC